jgi:anti-sigma factor RsiW
MTCSSVDLKAYMLGELPESEKLRVAGHVRECASCGEEVERLSLTHLALVSLRDEEVPRRIAFVSDKVFEPRWWQRVWQSGPAMAFASAAVLACAILAHGLVAYGFGRPIQPANQATVDTAVIEQRVEARVNQRVNAAVSDAVTKAVFSAVSENDARQRRETAALLADVQQKYDLQRKADMLAVEANFQIFRKEQARLYMASSGLEVRP